MLTLPIRYANKCGARPFALNAGRITYFRTCPVVAGHGRNALLSMIRWSSSTARSQLSRTTSATASFSQGLTLRSENFRQGMLPITSLLLSLQRFGFNLASFRRKLWCESTATSYHSQRIEHVKEIAIEDASIKSKSLVANTTIIRIWHLVKPDIILLLSVILTAVGAAMVNLSTPAVTGQLINIIAKSISTTGSLTLEELNGPALKLLGLFVTQGLLTFAHISLVSALGENIASRLRRELFTAILSQDIAFHDKYKSGELIGRLTTDISEFKHTFKQIITQGLKSITQTLGSTIRLFNISAPLTFTLCATTPILYAVLNFYGAYLRELSKKGRIVDGAANGIASESIANVRTVRAFAAEDRECASYEDMCINVANSNKYLGYHIGLFQGITNTCIGCMVLIVLYFGGTMVIRKEITGGDLMAYMLSTQTTQRSLGSLGVLFGQTIKAMGSAARVFEFIHLQPVIPTHGGIIPDSIEGNIEFRNVYFSYPTRPDHQVLSNFSLIIRKGTMVALCGPSGSGKSTVGSLIERFYEANKGGIYVDGLPIESLDPAWLRQQIGYINQEPTLFATTILENIRYGRPQATKEEVVAAARRANADAFIESFPDEYDTIVGERGVTLSGGQKQRIAIARAILKDPKILILDEATSALDTQSEELVQEALDKLMEGRTVIVIAHRLSTIQAADTIIVMGRVAGNIIEQGSHKELLSKRGLYFQLY